ncbi:MAG: nucleotide sugar dehydrogenase [Candidatus Omnitrophota bacterium]
MFALAQFREKIRKKKARIGIIGLGYVGLPLAVAFAKKGFFVTGIDVERQRVKKLNEGVSPILDISSRELKSLLRSKRFHATTDHAALSLQDAILVCVPTPLKHSEKPDISYIMRATKEIVRTLRKGQLIVLESTTYPGTTEEKMLPRMESKGLKVEKDFFLAFSPERVDPGNKAHTTISIPKVVGGIGPLSTCAAQILYGSVLHKVVPVSSAKTAEMVKLLENAFRSINIGFVNELAIICHKLKVDVWEVIEAAKTKPFGFMPFYPGPGIGGHCIPIDPLYLSWKSNRHGYREKMIRLASHINGSMPTQVGRRIDHLLKKRGVPMGKSSILLLGIAYKKDVDDYRESPSLDVMKYLSRKGAKVSYSDPFVSRVPLGRKVFSSRDLTPTLLKKHHCVVVLTDHSTFDYPAVVKHARLILDTRNVLRKYNPSKNLFFL